MARTYLTHINLSKNELQNAAVQNLATAPAAPVKGQLYFDTVSNTLYWWDGTQWMSSAGASPAQSVGGSSVGDLGVVGTSILYAREDHKHSREPFGPSVAEVAFGGSKYDGTASSVARSDHQHGNPVHDAAAHSTIPISALAPATGPINMGGFPIQGVGAPVNPDDAANKGYVDNTVAGLSWKEAVRAASAADFPSLAGLLNVDSIAVLDGERVLVKNQTLAETNGIYIVHGGAWTRATDFDAAGEAEGAAVFVMEGATQADTAWVCSTDGPIVIGTTPQVWSQFSGGAAVNAGAGLVLSGNTFNVTAGDASITVGPDTVIVSTDGVTNAKLANMPAMTVKGNNTAAVADPIDLTMAQLATALGGLRKFSTPLPNATAATVNHNLGTYDVITEVYRTASPGDTVECDIERSGINSLVVRFVVAPPALGDYTIVVIG